MKLLTHNMLTSRMVKQVKVGYPLKINSTETQIKPVEFSGTFIAKIIPKLEWSALLMAVKNIGMEESCSLPLELVDDYERNDEFLRKAHHALMEIEVIQGELECPETGRKFPISLGIPNMLVNEDEV